jgi:hypothetical protein
MFRHSVASAVALVGILSVATLAAPVTFTGAGTNPEGGNSLAASVIFDVVAGNLQVTLSNTAASAVSRPSDVLTAVFWDTGTALSLTPLSAVLAPGSGVFRVEKNGPVWSLEAVTVPDDIVGGEWAYKHTPSGLGSGVGQDTGISSSGLGIFGSANFPGSNLAGPVAVDGLQYGLASAGGALLQQNLRNVPLIHNSVVFTLSGLPGGFDPSAQISNVRFQYGTGLSEPFLPGTPTTDPDPGPVPTPIPLPATAWLAMGLLGLMASLRAVRRARAA